MVSPQPVNFLPAGLIDRVEERLQWLRVWLMSEQKKTDPTSLRIAVRIRPSMTSQTIFRAGGAQFHNIDTLGQE